MRHIKRLKEMCQSTNPTVSKWGILISTVVLLFLTGAQGAEGQDNWDAYRNAIKDAATYNHNKVLRLHPLQPDGGRVRVVTYTNYPYPDGPYPKQYHIPERVYVWVTADGEVQNVCRQFHLTGGELTLRLNQLLGLRPDTNYTHFLVLSVPAGRIFRPTPDPSTTQAFPCADPKDDECGNAFPSSAPASHIVWMSKQSLKAYQIGQAHSEDGFPWTHLGFTYDWAPYVSNKYGASEYVIMEDTEVSILEKTGMDPYCSSEGTAKTRP
jgi:hypothetical protein